MYAPTPEGWVGPKWPPIPGELPHDHDIYVTEDFETGNRYARCMVRGCTYRQPLQGRYESYPDFDYSTGFQPRWAR